MASQDIDRIIPERGAVALSTQILTGPGFYQDYPGTNESVVPVDLYGSQLQSMPSAGNYEEQATHMNGRVGTRFFNTSY